MEMQKLAFFRDAPAPWQGPPPGGPDSLTAWQPDSRDEHLIQRFT